MYLAQKGWLPRITYIIGAFITLYGGMAYIYNAIYTFQIVREQSTALEAVISVIVLSPLLIFVVVGLIIAGSFPELRIVENGLKYRYLFVKGLVRWDEMEELVALKRPQGCLALVIKRKGFALFNGLWINALYGTGIGHENPVVLISRGLEQRAEFLSEIAAHSGIQISNRFTQG